MWSLTALNTSHKSAKIENIFYDKKSIKFICGYLSKIALLVIKKAVKKI